MAALLHVNANGPMFAQSGDRSHSRIRSATKGKNGFDDRRISVSGLTISTACSPRGLNRPIGRSPWIWFESSDAIQSIVGGKRKSDVRQREYRWWPGESERPARDVDAASLDRLRFDLAAVRSGVRDYHTPISMGSPIEKRGDKRAIRRAHEHVDAGKMIDVEEHKLAAIRRKPIIERMYHGRITHRGRRRSTETSGLEECRRARRARRSGRDRPARCVSTTPSETRRWPRRRCT